MFFDGMKGIKDSPSTYLLDTWLVTLKGTLLRSRGRRSKLKEGGLLSGHYRDRILRIIGKFRAMPPSSEITRCQ